MNEKPSSPESFELDQHNNITKFKELLKGWRTNPDGEDFCPDCFSKYLSQFDNEHKKLVLDDSRATSDLADSRKITEGHWTECEQCQQEAFVPYETKI